MLLVACAVVLGAALQSAVGFGYGLLVAPALVGVLDPEEALGLLLVLSVLLNLQTLAGERRAHEVARREIAPLVLFSIPGMVAGVYVLESMTRSSLQVTVGGAVLATAAIRFWSFARERRREAGPRPALSGRSVTSARALVGLSCGALTTSTSISGPPIVLWLGTRDLEPGEMRDSLAAFFLATAVLGAVALVALTGTRQSLGEAQWLLLLVPLTAIGHLLGRRLFERLHPEAHRVALLLIVLVAGAASLVAGLL